MEEKIWKFLSGTVGVVLINPLDYTTILKDQFQNWGYTQVQFISMRGVTYIEPHPSIKPGDIVPKTELDHYLHSLAFNRKLDDLIKD